MQSSHEETICQEDLTYLQVTAEMERVNAAREELSTLNNLAPKTKKNRKKNLVKAERRVQALLDTVCSEAEEISRSLVGEV